MRGWVFAGFLCLAASPAAGQDMAASFALVLPDTVADVRGWETVSGEFEGPHARGAYLFHVNPRLQAVYQVMRYRVELVSPRTNLQRRRRSGERLAFVRNPGQGVPMQCWERRGPSSWRELTAGTDEYKLEMRVLMQVLGMHRTARVSAPPPSSPSP